MDGHSHLSTPNSAPTPSARKRRPDFDDSPAAQEKREKARERQRRKRERDRAGMMVMSFPPPPAEVNPATVPPPVQPVQQGTFPGVPPPLTPEEVARRERVRAHARERQRKHRALVKQRKLQELGLDMGNEVLHELDHYRQNGSASHFESSSVSTDANNTVSAAGVFVDSSSDGHTFASTLLLSLSCSPLLKQHVTRTLSMTNEDLAAMEPILANAWTQWDQQRRMHFAKQAAIAQGSGGTGQSASAIPSLPYSVDPNGTSAEDFRARFHRSLVTPSPFQLRAAVEHDANNNTQTMPPSPPRVAESGAETIDPHLSTAETVAETAPDGDQSEKVQE